MFSVLPVARRWLMLRAEEEPVMTHVPTDILSRKMFATATQHGTTRCVDDKIRKKSSVERIHGTCSSSDLRHQPSRCQCRCQICLHFPASIIFAQAADVSARTRHPMDSSLSFNRCTTHCSCPLLRLEVIDFESYTSGTNNRCVLAKIALAISLSIQRLSPLHYRESMSLP